MTYLVYLVSQLASQATHFAIISLV